MSLKNLMKFVLDVQRTATKEEAFLKGYLMALGGVQVLLRTLEGINWDLMEKDPAMWVKLEKDVVLIGIKVATNQHEEAIALAKKYKVTGY